MMDAWQRLLDGEAEEWRLLLREEFLQGEFEMRAERLIQLQEEAYQAYNRLSSAEAGSYAVAIAACEIALQQARIAETLAKQNELLDRIAKRLEEQ